jgi:Leucine-rich repeat (LRR) protein
MQMVKGKVTHFPDLSQVATTFPHLYGFGITFTKLKHVDRAKLKFLDKLKFFLISDNEIEEIAADTFHDLNNLELIDICRNQIKQLEPDWLSEMQKLRVFKARSNKFQYVPSGMFKNNHKLEEILFDYNEIKRIDVNFGELKNLKNLAILGNSCINMQYCKDPEKSECVKSLQQMSFFINGYCGQFSE